MSDVDWLALWVEFAQATDNKQIEVAERIVYFDGRLDFTELSRSTLLSAARQIIRERVEKSWDKSGPSPLPPSRATLSFPSPFAGEINFIEIINSVMGYDTVACDSDTHK
jgi:hypothetical protein